MKMPDGFIRVSKGEFYRRLFADHRDIVPRLNSEDQTDWTVRATGEVWGISWPGWKNPGDKLQVYVVRDNR
jgi:hypothetical protein